MVHEDYYQFARALTERIMNLYGVRVGRNMVHNRLVAKYYLDPRILRKPLLTVNNRWLHLDWARMWQNMAVGAWSDVIWGDELCFQLYPVDGRMRVHWLLGERFQQDCQATRVEPGWGSFHVWGHSTGVSNHPLCSAIGTSMPWCIRTSCGTPDNFSYQDDTVMSRHSMLVTDYLQQKDITKMDQPAQSPDCNPIEHLWDELWRAINNMDHPSHNLHELCQALLDQWANIPVGAMTPLIGRDRSYVT